MAPRHALAAFASTVALSFVVGCSSDGPSAPAAATASPAALVSDAQILPSGERWLGQVSIEPAYNDANGTITYLATPMRAPFPSKANAAHATAPLYLVEYPPGSSIGTLNCMGIPGNCPDHDAEVAGAATQIMPTVYGTDPSVLPGHDHLVSVPGGGGDFNVAWEVWEVLFTSRAAATEHLTTEAQVDAAIARHDAIKVDLGFAFNCSVVSAAVYRRGTPPG